MGFHTVPGTRARYGPIVYDPAGIERPEAGDGASGAHSDITDPEVAHAIWEAAFPTAHARQEV